MNPRIKQLYEQAMEQHVSNNMAWEELNPEKFAELIVRECCAIVHKKTDESIRVVMAIEEHFGVEE